MSYGKNWADAGDLAALDSAAIAATGNSTPVDISAYDGQCAFILGTKNTAGTNPTLAAKLQHCATSGGSYTDVPNGAFTGRTTGSLQEKLSINVDELHPFVQIAYTLGGTVSPAYAVQASIIGAKKVND